MPLVLLIAVLVSGCSTMRSLEPNTVAVYGEHVSHVTQHEPFTSETTNYGYNTVNVSARWQCEKSPCAGAFLEVAEGLNVGRRDDVPFRSYSGLAGPREVFSARAGYQWRVKP
jgi:hypothetical protein